MRGSVAINNSTGANSGLTISQPPFGTLTVAYNAAADSYTIADGTVSRTFASADGIAATTAFDHYEQVSGSTVNDLSLFTPGPTNSRLHLTYVTYGFWTTTSNDGATTNVAARLFAAGVQTSAADMPLTGNATYTGVVDGLASIGGATYRLLGSTGTLRANFGTGVVSTTMALVGNSDIMAEATGTAPLGTLTGIGAIGAGTNRYSGAISGLGTMGTFNGAFFGPGAQETGFAFQASGGGNAASGVFVGQK